MQEIDATADGRALHLAHGESLRLTLAETPSTGFRWRIVDDATSVLALRDDSFTTGGTAPGAGGQRRFTWEATQSGEAALRLDYARSWGSGPPARRFGVILRVAPLAVSR